MNFNSRYYYLATTETDKLQKYRYFVQQLGGKILTRHEKNKALKVHFADLPQLSGPAPRAQQLRPADVRHRLRGDRAHLQRQRGGNARQLRSRDLNTSL